MIFVDNIIIAVIAISVLIGLFRGFVPEVMSIVVWVAAVFLSWQYADLVAVRLEQHIDSPALLTWLSRAITFAGVLITGGVTTSLVSLLVEKTGLSGTDRVLGMAFGFARGVLVVGVLVIFANALELQQESWWDESVLIPYGERVAGVVLTVLPEDVSARLPEAVQQMEEAADVLGNATDAAEALEEAARERLEAIEDATN
ncbi:MAG: CvpA family protein [Pseudomonadota bacterium]